MEEKKELATVDTFTDTKAVAMARVIFPHLEGVQDIEIAKALATARYIGLDPLKRECHFVPFKGTVQIVTAYTEYIKRAERSGKLDGWQVEVSQDGKIAKVTIYRKDWSKPFTWEVRLEEVKRETPTWKSMPIFMLKKVAIAQAFRLAFPEEVAELPYTEEEQIIINGKDVINTRTGEVIETQEEKPQEKWTMQKINQVASPELKQAVSKYGATAKLLEELFTRFDGDQQAIIAELERLAQERKAQAQIQAQTQKNA